jgi:iron complex outermembrane receptor protein
MHCSREMKMRLLPGFALMWSAASAQTTTTQTSRALDQASDAFGVRSGVEQVGLYSETQVRGLSLQEAGNYRLEGAYFVRAGNLVDPVLLGVGTRVGISALGLDFPAPTGMVEYRLRSPMSAPALAVDLTAREYGGRLFEVTAAERLSPTAAVLAGGQVSVARSSAGLVARSYRLGLLTEWQPNERARLLGLASLNRFGLEGSYGVTATGGKLPPRMSHPRRYVPHWADHDGWDINLGLIGRLAPTHRVSLTGSLILSQLLLPESDFVNLAIGAGGHGTATIVSNRPRSSTSLAAGAGVSWQLTNAHRLFGEVRLRRTANRFRPSTSFRVGDVTLHAGLPSIPEPILGRAVATKDDAEQMIAGFGYEGEFGAYRLKGGLQRAIFERTFQTPGQPVEFRSSAAWLYDLSLVAKLATNLTGWASVTRGLEDAGVAPANASNRNEVLPAVLSNQREAGVRVRGASGVSIVAAAFSIRKPAAVFDGKGRFGLAGSLEHRGAELSIAGPVAPRLRLLAGGTLLRARRQGELVRAGLLSAEPAGLSRLQGLVGLTWTVPHVGGLSLDGQLNFASSRRVRSDRDLRAPAFATLDLGALYAFHVEQTALSLRLRITNFFDSDAWVVNRSELLDRLNRRGLRLSLSARL